MGKFVAISSLASRSRSDQSRTPERLEDLLASTTITEVTINLASRRKSPVYPRDFLKGLFDIIRGRPLGKVYGYRVLPGFHVEQRRRFRE